jgi:O-antigen/teichoic acid export membrane protein
MLKTCGIAQALGKNWQHGRNLLPSYLLEWVRTQGFIILGGLLIGVQAVGAIRAAQNIMGPLNVFYQAIDNIFPIEGAKRLANEGKKSMVSYFLSSGAKGIALFAIPCLIISASSYWIMDFLYGHPFTNFHTLVIWQAFSVMLAFAYRIGTSFLRAANITKPIFSSSIVGCVGILIFIVPLSSILSEDGVMLAKIIAEIFSISFVWLSINRYITKQKSDHSS